ncbi:hypothetical protein niasHS_016846 [Heterodera schachtii]|uniref:Ubiquitin-like domain-containing protein n=1 Tax=Heterodera schachtii TaxID=97005 RepID=A0ABD2HU81_HETSC
MNPGFGISAGLTVFMLLMIRSSIADYEIKIMMFDYPKYNDQTIFTVMVKGKDTVADLKKISEELKVELEPERLMLRSDMSPYDAPFEDNYDMLWQHDLTIGGGYGIRKGSIVYVDRDIVYDTLDAFKIWVQYEGQKHAILVKGVDTVRNLKVNIENTRAIGILRGQQRLECLAGAGAAADGVVLEEDEKTMNYYKIKEHSTVLLTRAAAEMEQQHDEKPSSSRKKEKNLGTGTKIMGFLHRHSG